VGGKTDSNLLLAFSEDKPEASELVAHLLALRHLLDIRHAVSLATQAEKEDATPRLYKFFHLSFPVTAPVTSKELQGPRDFPKNDCH
jgi:hypothetical protein